MLPFSLFPGRIVRLAIQACVPVAFFACQITKFALCYPNLAFSEEGVDAILSWRLINPRKLQRVKCKVALGGWLAYIPSTGIRSVNPTVRLTRPKIEVESAYLDSA